MNCESVTSRTDFVTDKETFYNPISCKVKDPEFPTEWSIGFQPTIQVT